MLPCLFDCVFVLKQPIGFSLTNTNNIALFNVFLFFYFDRQISTYQRYKMSYCFAFYEVLISFLTITAEILTLIAFYNLCNVSTSVSKLFDYFVIVKNKLM